MVPSRVAQRWPLRPFGRRSIVDDATCRISRAVHDTCVEDIRRGFESQHMQFIPRSSFLRLFVFAVGRTASHVRWRQIVIVVISRV